MQKTERIGVYRRLRFPMYSCTHVLDITTSFVHNRIRCSGRMTSEPAVIGRGRRNQDWSPENLLIKWRSHAGCGFNLSTCQPWVCSYTYDPVAFFQTEDTMAVETRR